MIFAVIFTGCTKEEDPVVENTFPVNFKVDIPTSLSNAPSTKNTKEDGPLKGGEMYEHLRTFIHIGEAAADMTELLMGAIRTYNLSQAMEISFVSDDDNRTKNIVVIENSDFENSAWEYQLTMTDADSEGNADNGNAMQIFWNKNPVKGISILKPYNLNRAENQEATHAIYRIDYSEAGENKYDQEMTVYIARLPLADPAVDPYSVNSLKMFAGKKGDIVDVFGNSNHPNASFFTNESGFNWVFVAAGDKTQDIGVAELALPPSDLNSNARKVILKDYSFKTVFTNLIYEAYPTITQDLVDYYLQVLIGGY